MLLMGSPTKRKRPKAINPTASITLTDCSTRRRTKAITDAAQVLAPGCPRPQGAPTTLFELDPVPHENVVRQLHELDVVLDAPGKRLLMQRNVTDLVLVDLEGLGDFRLPLLGIDFAL